MSKKSFSWNEIDDEIDHLVGEFELADNPSIATIRNKLADVQSSLQSDQGASTPIAIPIVDGMSDLGDGLKLLEVTSKSPLQIQFALQHIAECFREECYAELHLPARQFEAKAEGDYFGFLFCIDPRCAHGIGFNQFLKTGVVVGGALFLPRKSSNPCLMWIWFHPILRRRGKLQVVFEFFGHKYGKPMVLEPPLTKRMVDRLQKLDVKYTEMKKEQPVIVSIDAIDYKSPIADIEIRRAVPGDIEAMVNQQLMREPDVISEKCFLSRSFPMAPYMIIALRNGQIIGKVSIDLWHNVAQQADVANIDNLRVIEVERGNGVGGLLIEAAEALATQGGKTITEIGVNFNNIRPLRLYVRKGYHREPRTPELILIGFPECGEQGITIVRYNNAIVVRKNLGTDGDCDATEAKRRFDVLMTNWPHAARYDTAHQYVQDDYLTA